MKKNIKKRKSSSMVKYRKRQQQKQVLGLGPKIVNSVVIALNENDAIHGVLLFRPLPKHMNVEKIIIALDFTKDVDGITDGSLAGVFAGKAQGFLPCTPQGCMEISDHYGIDCTGKKGCCGRQKSGGWQACCYDAYG